jgi:hypothetical protein
MLFTALYRSDRSEAIGVGTTALDDSELRAHAIDAIERWAARHP